MSQNVDTKNPKVVQHIVRDFATSSQDLSKVQSLILAHEHFVKSDVLLEAFILEFSLIKKDDQINQFRVVNFLKKWIDLERGKFINKTEGIGKKLNEFIKSSILPDPLAKTLASALADENTKTGLGDDDEDEEEEEIPVIIMKKKKKSVTSELLSYDPLEIARQLTLIDYRYIGEVSLKEFLNSSWLKKDESPTLNKNVERANALAHWIGYEMIICKAKYRPKLLTQILRVMLQFPSKTKSIWDNAQFLLSYNNNYTHYRDLVKKKHPPMIPCQEIFLKDLLYHDESFPNYNSDGVVDFKKLDVMGNIINFFRKCQTCKFKLQQYKELYEYLLAIRTNINLETLEKLATSPTSLLPEKVGNSLASTDSSVSTQTEQSETDSHFEARALGKGRPRIGSISSNTKSPNNNNSNSSTPSAVERRRSRKEDESTDVSISTKKL